MARAKSTSGGKTTANANTSVANTNTNKEQASVSNPASLPEVKTEGQTPALQGSGLQGNAQGSVRANVQAAAPETAPAATKPEPVIAPEPRKKLEVVKTEPRRVVPINVEEEIRRRAYELYQQRGSKPGSEREDWLAAEREVRQRYHQQQQSA
jgi:hypothetical protein